MPYHYQQHIYSESFIELAYRALRSITSDQKKTLSIYELKYFKSEYDLKKFVAEERMDHVMYILTKVGFSWTFRIERDQWAAEMVEFNSEDQWEYPQKRIDVTEATAREGVCVISSRDVMHKSHMMAQNVATKVYQISQFSKDLQQKGRDLKQLRRWDDEIALASKAHDMWNDILLEQLNSFEYAESTLGLDYYDLRILAALYKVRNRSIRMKEISELTKAKGKKMYFRKNLEKLLELNLVATDAKDAKKNRSEVGYFMITTKGIGSIMEYRKFVYENTFGPGK